MIKLLRVDHRLLHGQVAFSWTSKLSADCILIASDAVMNDDLRKMSIKLAKPTGVKLVIKNRLNRYIGDLLIYSTLIMSI